MAVRSAEAERLSSCSFADRVADLSIKFFRSKCPPELLGAYKQTVIATIIVQIPNNTPTLQNEEKNSNCRTTLKVLSLGVGTKVLNADQIVVDKSINTHGGKLIRDCHAEILARRGFLAYLYSELESLTETPQSQSGETHTISHQHNKQQHSIFEYNPIGKKLQLKRSVTLHMYTSSQPCGNASIKRWAKSKAPPQDTSLSPDEYPVETHTKIQITEMNRSAGQVAVLVKKNKQNSAAVSVTVGTSTETTPTGPSTTTPVNSSTGNISSSGSNNPNSHKVKSNNNSTRNTALYECMLGTAPTDSGMGNVMTCSDKIAKWNALGLQGTLLSHFYEPLFLSTITIGRKFSKIHAERALCCRLQDFCYPVTAGAAAGGGCKKRSGKLSNKRGRYEVLSADNSSNNCGNVLSEASTTSQTNSRSDDLVCTVAQTIVGGTVYYRIHHPVMLGTKVKFDESSIITGTTTTIKTPFVTAAAVVATVGAQFSDWRSLCCWADVDSLSECFGKYTTEVIDGHTGLVLCPVSTTDTAGPAGLNVNNFDDDVHRRMTQPPPKAEGPRVSQLSSACFGVRFRTLMTRMVESSVGVGSNSSGWSDLSYMECKKWVSGPSSQSNNYGAAKSCLMYDDKLFGEWIVK